jgi:hypothetical protein
MGIQTDLSRLGRQINLKSARRNIFSSNYQNQRNSLDQIIARNSSSPALSETSLSKDSIKQIGKLFNDLQT